MDRDGLLRSIAETGYNVGFGAKKNFATHDIVQKAPGLISRRANVNGANGIEGALGIHCPTSIHYAIASLQTFLAPKATNRANALGVNPSYPEQQRRAR